MRFCAGNRHDSAHMVGSFDQTESQPGSLEQLGTIDCKKRSNCKHMLPSGNEVEGMRVNGSEEFGK